MDTRGVEVGCCRLHVTTRSREFLPQTPIRPLNHSDECLVAYGLSCPDSLATTCAYAPVHWGRILRQITTTCLCCPSHYCCDRANRGAPYDRWNELQAGLR